MSKERIVKAAFANGVTLERGSASKVYAYAYYACGRYRRAANAARPQYPAVDREWSCQGFSSTEALATRALASELRWRTSDHTGGTFTIEFKGVVPVTAIDKRTKAST